MGFLFIKLVYGDYLAETIKETINTGDVDVVMPIPDSSDHLQCKLQDSWE